MSGQAPPRPRLQAGRPAGPPPRRPPGSGAPAGGNGVRPPPPQQQTPAAPQAAPPRPRPPNPGRTAPPRGPPRPAGPRPRPPGPLPARPDASTFRPQQQTGGQGTLTRPDGVQQQQPQLRPRPPAPARGLAPARPEAPAAVQPPPAGTEHPAAGGERKSATLPGSTAEQSVQSSRLQSTADNPTNAARSAPAAASSAQQPASSGGGWGSLGGWTSALREVATNVTRDVTGLTTSFQQALAEVDDSDVSDEEGRAGQQTQAPPQRRPSPVGPPTSSARGRPPPGAAAASMQASRQSCDAARHAPLPLSSRQTDTSAACKRHKLPDFALMTKFSSQQVQGDTDSEAARRRALAKLEGDDSQMQNSVKVHRGCAAPALNMSNAVGPCPAKRSVTADCVWVVAGIRQAGGSACQWRTAEGAALPCTAATVSLKASTLCIVSSITILSMAMCP